MKILFVTGSDAAFFNSLLICLQSFAERMPGERLLVCDFGLTDAQARFLRGLGLLLERPPILDTRGVFHRKAALFHYLRHNNRNPDGGEAVMWLDADVTLMEIGPADIGSALADMQSAGADIAVCREIGGRNVGQMIALFADSRMAPFARAAAAANVDASLPYYSSGLFICRAMTVLEHWAKLAEQIVDHPLFDQNVLNVTLHRDRVPVLALDCEEWQAYGNSLDRVRLIASANRVAAHIGSRNIKSLHASSPAPGHLLIGVCRVTVRNLDLAGPYKLFLAEPLRMHQLQLLAQFVVTHGETLLRLGICTRAMKPVEGFEFVTL
jgi:hypothetical protein